jgi:type II restriction enzyme
LKSYIGAAKAALHIDCIWFKNGKLMPAVMEVEHSTGVNSGLSRMKDLYECIPGHKTRYVIVASDEDREDVFKKASKEQFKVLDVRYFPYSAVEELYSICKRRKLKGITEEFLDCFMEPVNMN